MAIYHNVGYTTMWDATPLPGRYRLKARRACGHPTKDALCFPSLWLGHGTIPAGGMRIVNIKSVVEREHLHGE